MPVASAEHAMSRTAPTHLPQPEEILPIAVGHRLPTVGLVPAMDDTGTAEPLSLGDRDHSFRRG